MSGKQYIPANDAQFITWAENMAEIAAERCEEWSVSPPDDIIGNTLADFKAKYAKFMNPNRGKIDTLEKNEARKVAEKACRTYVQGFLARNPKIADVDRERMGITVYDTIPTSVGNPVGLVTATVKYPNEGALELSIKHVEGSPFDARANYGVKIRYGVFAVGEAAATDVNQLADSLFTRKKKELFTFDRKDRQKTACFCLRYENSKGQAGQWGGVVSAIIP